ncbi:MAG: serpin family protein [Oscillospiraceae bacterium]
MTLTETDCRTAAVAADFSITLLRNAAKPDKTTLLSPYSVLLALGMTANGANSATLQEMEQALGAKTDDLNHWLAACRLAEDGKVVSANSLWTRQELEVGRSSGRRSGNSMMRSFTRASSAWKL